jgi:hypothetical protein
VARKALRKQPLLIEWEWEPFGGRPSEGGPMDKALTEGDHLKTHKDE